MHDPLLCPCQFEGEVVFIKSVEGIAHSLQYVALVASPMVGGVAQDVELHIEEFLKLEPLLRLLYIQHILGIVYLYESLSARDEVEWGGDKLRQCLGKSRLRYLLHQSLREFLYLPRLQSRLLHLLRRGVIRLHAHRGEFDALRLVDVGMCKLVAASIDSRFAEHDVVDSHLIIIIYVLRALPPHEVHHAMAVAEVGHHALAPSTHGKLLKRQYPAPYLHKGHRAVKFVDGIYAAAVHILVWIVFQQVAPCVDVELAVEHGSALGTHAREKLYVLIENI